MKTTKLIVVLTASLLSFPLLSYGKEVTSDLKESPVTITIVKSALGITKVEAPRFGTDIEVHQGEQTLTPENDLVIRVEDTRDSKQTSWGIQYQLTMFQNDKKVPLSNQGFHLKKGSLKADNQLVDGADYQPQEVHLQGKGSQVLVHNIQGSARQYEYRVNKKDIRLELPKGVPEGTYTAVQTITLMNSSEAE